MSEITAMKKELDKYLRNILQVVGNRAGYEPEIYWLEENGISPFREDSYFSGFDNNEKMIIAKAGLLTKTELKDVCQSYVRRYDEMVIQIEVLNLAPHFRECALTHLNEVRAVLYSGLD